MSASRAYHQHCGLARAMDVLGERWSVLILRELSLGPRRYGDLAASLPGIGTNLLAARLRTLQDQGVIHRITLPAPANVPAYALTARGEQLEPILENLAVWGFDLLPERPAEGDVVRAAWAAMSMGAMFNHSGAAEPRGTFAFVVGDERLHVTVDERGAHVRQGIPGAPTATLTAAGPGAFAALASGDETPSRAAAAGHIEVDGDPAVLDRLFTAFRLPERTGAPPATAPAGGPPAGE